MGFFKVNIATLTVEQVLQFLEKDSDDDFDGYFEEDYENEESNDKVSESVAVSTSSSQEESSTATLPTSATLPTLPSFTGSSGAVLDVRDKSLLEIFSLLVPDELLEVIVEQTNLFAQQFLDKENVPPYFRVHEWG